MTGRILFCLLLVSGLGYGDVGAQESPRRGPGASELSEPASSLLVDDTTLLPATRLSAFDQDYRAMRLPGSDQEYGAMGPLGSNQDYLPYFQVEEDEPGSFFLGALVGGVATAVYLSKRSRSRGDGGYPPHWVPLGALMGGIIFWSAGIG